MTRTPWGEASELRERRLAPGSRIGREEVARNQRERIFGAMVACVAERGYEATRVADLVELSGVSRSDFYEHFADKRACFAATLEAALEGAMGLIGAEYDGRGSGLAACVEVIAAQPAAARLAMIDAYSAGPEATALVDRAVAGAEALYARAFAERHGEAMPEQLVRAIVGGLRWVIQAELLGGEEAKLVALVPGLRDWSLGYEPPPQPLRRRARRGGGGGRPREGGDAGERIIRGTEAAIAARGYAAATITDIVERAGVSLSTFYANFEGKEEAFRAALDAGQARMFAATLPVYRRNRRNGWPAAVRAGLGALLRFMSSEPEFTQMAVVETYGAGASTLRQRNAALAELRPYVQEGYGLAPQVSPVAALAIPGAVSALIYNELRAGGTAGLPALEPLASYLVLAPFLGAEEACAVARGER